MSFGERTPVGHAPWVTPEQCKAARFLLGWAVKDLSLASGTGVDTITRFETGRPPLVKIRTIRGIRAALERCGIRFEKLDPEAESSGRPSGVVLEDGSSVWIGERASEIIQLPS